LEKYNSEKSIEEIYAETNGNPVLVKFSIFGNGIDIDVKERYYRYLQDSNAILTMIMCCLFELSGLSITDKLLEDFHLLGHAYKLESATLHRYDTEGWKTLHPIWDLYLLFLIFRGQNKALILEKEQLLIRILRDLFNWPNKLIILSVIRTLYFLTFRGILDLVTVEKVVHIPPNIDIKTRCKINTTIGMAYFMWKKIDRATEKFNECLFLDPNNTDAMNDKGALFLLIGRNILEAISCFNNALALKPDSSMPLNNLGLAFDQFRCYFTAIGYFEECNRIDPLFTKAWYNLGRALDELGEYNRASECYDRALDLDPNSADAWHNKAVSFHKQLRFDDAIYCYDKAVEINPAKPFSHYGKYLALKKEGGFSTVSPEQLLVELKYTRIWLQFHLMLGRTK